MLSLHVAVNLERHLLWLQYAQSCCCCLLMHAMQAAHLLLADLASAGQDLVVLGQASGTDLQVAGAPLSMTPLHLPEAWLPGTPPHPFASAGADATEAAVLSPGAARARETASEMPPGLRNSQQTWAQVPCSSGITGRSSSRSGGHLAILMHRLCLRGLTSCQQARALRACATVRRVQQQGQVKRMVWCLHGPLVL